VAEETLDFIAVFGLSF